MIVVAAETVLQKRAVAEWLAARVPFWSISPGRASFLASLGVDGEVLGAAAYHDYREIDIEMSCAGEPGWLSKGALAVYFAFPFVQLECRRITVICHKKNRTARRFVERLGFVREGAHRQAMPDGADSISYGLLRADCRWLPKQRLMNGHGKEEFEPAAAARH